MVTRDKPQCLVHELSEPCLLCFYDAWPTKDLRAVADFAGKPEGGEFGLIPGVKYARLSAVIRSVGRRWAELETVKLTTFGPIYATKNGLVREIRNGTVNIGKLEIAARRVAKGFETDTDETVALYMKTIIEEESNW